MTKDPSVLSPAHEKAAGLIISYLEQGKKVVCLTLGDPTVYCSFSYLIPPIEKRGFTAEFINGVTSLCAVENCGMEDERVYPCADDIPDDAGYYTLIIAKK